MNLVLIAIEYKTCAQACCVTEAHLYFDLK